MMLTGDIKRGRIEPTQGNMILVNKVESIVNRVISDSTFIEDVTEFMGVFLGVFEYIKQTHKSLNKISIFYKDIEPLTKQYVKVYSNNILKVGLANNVVQSIKTALMKQIMVGDTIDNTKTVLNGMLTTTDTNYGLFEKFVLQTSKEAIYQYDGAVNGQIQYDHKLDGVLYMAGSQSSDVVRDKKRKGGKTVVYNSRPQCDRWLSKGAIPIKDLSTELDWALANGYGMIQGTNVNNFFANRGGYNCTHFVIPTNI